jgi:hypothetical protein
VVGSLRKFNDGDRSPIFVNHIANRVKEILFNDSKEEEERPGTPVGEAQRNKFLKHSLFKKHTLSAIKKFVSPQKPPSDSMLLENDQPTPNTLARLNSSEANFNKNFAADSRADKNHAKVLPFVSSPDRGLDSPFDRPIEEKKVANETDIPS